jgi:hypothetical protein
MTHFAIQDWLDSFVELVGLAEAQRLLQHVGQPCEATNLERLGFLV